MTRPEPCTPQRTGRDGRHGRKLLLATALLAALAGCAVPKQIAVQSTVDNDHAAHLGPGASIHVVEHPEHAAPPLHEELAAKIEDLLVRKRYRLSPAAAADYYLYFDFGTEQAESPSGRVRMPIDHPRRYQAGVSYVHFFRVRLVDAPLFRSSGEIRVVWEGNAVLSDTYTKNPRDPVELLDRLSLAAMQNVGRSADWAVSRE